MINAQEGGGYNVQATDDRLFLVHEDAIDVPVKVSKMLISDARLLHGYHANRSTKHRIAMNREHMASKRGESDGRLAT